MLTELDRQSNDYRRIIKLIRLWNEPGGNGAEQRAAKEKAIEIIKKNNWDINDFDFSLGFGLVKSTKNAIVPYKPKPKKTNRIKEAVTQVVKYPLYLKQAIREVLEEREQRQVTEYRPQQYQPTQQYRLSSPTQVNVYGNNNNVYFINRN